MRSGCDNVTQEILTRVGFSRIRYTQRIEG